MDKTPEEKQKSDDEYLEITSTRVPRKLMIEALTHLNEAQRGHALDLGAGALVDSVYFRSVANFGKVTAIDGNHTMLKYSQKVLEGDGSAQEWFKPIISKFEEFGFVANEYDFISAQYSLPFLPQNVFDSTIDKIVESLKVDGVFCGQFFGTEDGFNETEDITPQTEENIRRLFSSLDIIVLREVKEAGKTAQGEDNFWHYFEVIAVKRSST